MQGVCKGVYRDNGKENGRDYLGFRGYGYRSHIHLTCKWVPTFMQEKARLSLENDAS